MTTISRKKKNRTNKTAAATAVADVDLTLALCYINSVERCHQTVLRMNDYKMIRSVLVDRLYREQWAHDRERTPAVLVKHAEMLAVFGESRPLSALGV